METTVTRNRYLFLKVIFDNDYLKYDRKTKLYTGAKDNLTYNPRPFETLAGHGLAYFNANTLSLTQLGRTVLSENREKAVVKERKKAAGPVLGATRVAALELLAKEPMWPASATARMHRAWQEKRDVPSVTIEWLVSKDLATFVGANGHAEITPEGKKALYRGQRKLIVKKVRELTAKRTAAARRREEK